MRISGAAYFSKFIGSHGRNNNSEEFLVENIASATLGAKERESDEFEGRWHRFETKPEAKKNETETDLTLKFRWTFLSIEQLPFLPHGLFSFTISPSSVSRDLRDIWDYIYWSLWIERGKNDHRVKRHLLEHVWMQPWSSDPQGPRSVFLFLVLYSMILSFFIFETFHIYASDSGHVFGESAIRFIRQNDIFLVFGNFIQDYDLNCYLYDLQFQVNAVNWL